MNFKDLLSAFKTIEAADPKLVKSIADDLSLEKAAERLKASEEVKDNWTEGNVNRAATREEIKTGPTQEASGSGTERMNREYSNNAPQHGITLTAEKLSDMLRPMMAKAAAQGEAIGHLIENQRGMMTALSAILTKAAPGATAKAEEEEDDEDEESEVVEINASKAKSRLAKAASKLRLAKAKKAEMEDESDEEKCKALKAEIKALRKSAARLLGEARTAAYAAGDSDLKKAIRKAAAKADIDVVQEEEDEDDEDEEAEKAKKALAAKALADAEAAEKAKRDAAGNQADRADAATGNQAAAAKSTVAPEDLAALKSKLEGALSGMTTLTASVNQMMDVVSGRSSAASLTPNISKALTEPDSDAKMLENIRELENDGTLQPENAMAARDIVSRLAAVRKGVLDKSVLEDRLAKAPTAVRQLFANAA